MSLSNPAAPTTSNEFPPTPIAPSVTDQTEGRSIEADSFVDRRRDRKSNDGSERRQFGSSHEGLSEAGRELALAIDQYKLQHHRRYITCDEMLYVITNLGYTK